MKNGKILLTGLLLLASLLAGVLLFTLPSSTSVSILTTDDLYQKIDDSIRATQLDPVQFRKSSIKIDSSFSRSVYRINVPPSFSKTSFHLDLHHQLLKHDIHCPAKITFPEENMDIHIVYKNTVFRTIRLITTQNAENTGTNGRS